MWKVSQLSFLNNTILNTIRAQVFPFERTSIWSLFLLLTVEWICASFSSDMKRNRFKIETTTSPHDILPSRFIKQIFDTVGPDILSIINNCLSNGTVPACFKLATVTPIQQQYMQTIDQSPICHFYPKSLKKLFSFSCKTIYKLTHLWHFSIRL